jgi:hypothetical protein
VKRPVLAILGALILGGFVAAAQEPKPPSDPTELVNTLLGSLLGLSPMTEAELQREVAEVGGVPFRTPVPLEFMTPEQMGRYFEEMFDSEYPVSRASADERFLRALDLLPEGVNLRQVRARLLRENVVGFYDERPGKKRLYAVSHDRTLTPMNQLVLAHELRHALQDQHMKIHDLLADDVSDFDDRRMALLSLLEGDATLLMQKFLMRRLPGAEDAGFDSAGMTLPPPDMPGVPDVLRDQLVQPYLAGLEFARSVFSTGGWQGLQAAWKRPPDSSEQVLHPEKYAARESPRSVEIGFSPPGGKLLFEGTLGELLWRSVLGEGSEEAAAGWGGDRYRVLDLHGRTVVVSRSVWDSPQDAREFQKALLARYGSSHGRARSDGGFSVFERGSSAVAVGEWLSGVFLIAGDDRAAVLALVRKIQGG